jgi:hypothetical protein
MGPTDSAADQTYLCAPGLDRIELDQTSPNPGAQRVGRPAKRQRQTDLDQGAGGGAVAASFHVINRESQPCSCLDPLGSDRRGAAWLCAG